MTEFDDLFHRATGFEPYEYQRALGRLTTPPVVVNVPTGTGKTYAALIPWLADEAAPRRLVYALPMRSLVEQTRDVVRTALENLGDPTPVHTLMGGEPPSAWLAAPDQRAIIVGTIDMLVSAALNRGYGASRFAWPMSFAWLNNDCRWILDEIQLMGPARTTSAQLHGLRGALGMLLPCETTWMSATVDVAALKTFDHPNVGPPHILAAADRARPELARRLNATKFVERLDATAVRPARLASVIADEVRARHAPGTRSIVVVNRVERAQAIHAALANTMRKEPDRTHLVLLHSRFRPPDRSDHMRRATDPQIPAPGTIVVATQVIEAGVDLTSSLLVTETAPFSSIVQRLGRCNRDGNAGEATVLWLDRGELDVKAAAPYHPEDLATAREALDGLVGRSASPAVLETLSVAERREHTAVLRRRDLLDLFDTSPDLSGTDIDIAPYVRADDDRSVSVFFRDLAAGDGTDAARSAHQPKPTREELVSVPIGAVREQRQAWTFDIHANRWTLYARVAPGGVAMLAAAAGGYAAETGWTGNPRDMPDILAPAEKQTPEWMGGDSASVGATRWVTLADHLRETHDAAKALVAALGLEHFADAILRAAAFHDLGKAHDAFQEMLRSTALDGELASRGGDLLAKSPRRGGRNPRRFFRHELLSALALGVQGPSPARPEPPLVRYLVAAHHGRVRVAIRPVPDEVAPADATGRARFALGVVDGDVVPAVQTPFGTIAETTVSLDEMALGGGAVSWSDLALSLRDDHGPFVLAYLEAVVRVADWRASAHD